MPTDGPDPDGRDPMLDSMRSVWREMRDADEDPPTSGLAELMAAAHEQAESMRPRESWWRRAFAMLVRPPVLALATVLVVAGGAIALHRHGVSDATEPVHEQAPARDLEAAPMSSTGAGAELDDRGGASNEKAANTNEVTDSPATGATVPQADPESAPAVPHEHRAKRSTTTDAQVFGHFRQPGAATPRLAPPAPPPPPPIEPRGKRENPSSDVSAGDDDKAARGMDRGITKTMEIDESEPATEDAKPHPRGRVTVSTEQLIRQAQVAAQRKDCPAVRATTARIKKAAPVVFQKRVATQPAIARCLE